MSYNPRDAFFLKAKKEGFVARSVYKLKEIDAKFKVFRSGQTVLDLGAAPGSWSQYASSRIGPSGQLIGVDLSPIGISLPNCRFFQADLRGTELDLLFLENGIEDASKDGFSCAFDIVMSDMAPNTTGIKSADQARSLELCELALQTALKYLKPNGTFICKFFQSGEFGSLRGQIKRSFEKVDALKPGSTRSISKEIFLVGLKKK